MLDAPRSVWLPLQPLPAPQPLQHAAPKGRIDSRALPGCTCSIEALRDTFAPLYYQHIASTALQEVPSITHASTRDLQAILNLHASTLPLRYDPSFFISLLLNANYLVLVAKLSDGSVIGCATASLDPYGNDELELLTLCVDTGYTRNGIATALLHETARKAFGSPRNGALTATLRVQTTNSPALKLYTRLGFLIDGIETTYYKNAISGGSAAYRMKKRITSAETQ